jgi:hypothetical protein
MNAVTYRTLLCQSCNGSIIMDRDARQGYACNAHNVRATPACMPLPASHTHTHDVASHHGLTTVALPYLMNGGKTKFCYCTACIEDTEVHTVSNDQVHSACNCSTCQMCSMNGFTHYHVCSHRCKGPWIAERPLHDTITLLNMKSWILTLT